MSDHTIINPRIQETVINPNLEQKTTINQKLLEKTAEPFSGEVLLAGKYQILQPLNMATGEADLYLCKYGSKQYIAKIYRRHEAIKQEVVTALKAIESPYVASMIDAGEYNGLSFEILPYYKNGSLQGKTFSFEQLKQNIIPCMNEALHVLHQKDIIHKDIKPSNIMLQDDGRHVAIIDFGISSVVEQGNTVLVTKTGMTPEYAAPETFRNLYLEESDYYSFGITLYALFCGHTPYQNMDAETIARFTAVQRIPFPKEMPKELQELIAAVTYYDITNRHDKNNPNRRWTYQEVKRWCEGKVQPIPGESAGVQMEGWLSPYTFLRQSYREMHSLTVALASNWEEGKKQLYRGLMSGFFKNFDPETAGFCMDAEEAAMRTPDRVDTIFCDLLYKIDPKLKAFCWMGKNYASLPDLGRDMLENLWNGNLSDQAYWDSILREKRFTAYLSAIQSKNRSLVAAVSALETKFALWDPSERENLLNDYTIAYLFTREKILRLWNRQFKTISQLTEFMQSLLTASYEEFERFCNALIDDEDALNPQFEAWLIAIGKSEELKRWRSGVNMK